MARREGGTEKGGKLASADRCGNAQGIGKDGAVPGKRAVDHVALSLEAALVNAGAASGEAGAAASE
jgi:hypothetical protein